CLGQRPGTARIYACADMIADGFSLATSDDHGQSFQRMMSFTELLGPLTCAPVQTNCAPHWARIQGVLGITGDGGTPGPPDAGNPDAGTAPAPKPGGCPSGCSSAGGSAAAFLGLVAVVLLWRTRRPHPGR
ncbi:MAG TPA: MYXO-CTERM sorting domain-containing protein, partial [Myxococcaceae bacterium]|nr:MYXO-CTERM sorting domain-containing protein [Myxococcaceae bacterium]